MYRLPEVVVGRMGPIMSKYSSSPIAVVIVDDVGGVPLRALPFKHPRHGFIVSFELIKISRPSINPLLEACLIAASCKWFKRKWAISMLFNGGGEYVAEMFGVPAVSVEEGMVDSLFESRWNRFAVAIG